MSAKHHVATARLFGTAVFMQAMLSAASLLVGLILIRRVSSAQYGYYVLITNATLLLTAIQSAFIQPQMILELTRRDLRGRAELVGGLYREQRRLWPLFVAATMLIAVALRLLGFLSNDVLLIVLAAVAAIGCAMYREFFRKALLGYQLPGTVLGADTWYVVLLIAGAGLATFSPAPAATAAATLSIASLAGGTLAARSLRRHEAWDITGAPGILRTFAPLGAWSAAGAAVYWSYSQGYNYLVAGTLDVRSVAALAGTRLLMMPVNLLSTGISNLVFPTTTAWLQRHGAATVFRRLLLFATALAAAALCYFGVLWMVRDWVFQHVLKKEFANRDLLLASWGVVTLLTLYRDQLGYLLAARAKFRMYSSMTFVSAIIALVTSYCAIRRVGTVGALIGLTAGEFVNLTGIVFFSIRELKMRPQADSPVTKTV